MTINSSLLITINKPERVKENVWPWQWPWKAQDLKMELWVILQNGSLCILSRTSHEHPTYLGNFACLDFLSSYILSTNPFLFVPPGQSPTRFPLPSSGQCFSMKLSPFPQSEVTRHHAPSLCKACYKHSPFFLYGLHLCPPSTCLVQGATH